MFSAEIACNLLSSVGLSMLNFRCDAIKKKTAAQHDEILLFLPQPVCDRKRATRCLLRRHLILDVDVSSSTLYPDNYTRLMRKYRCAGAEMCRPRLVKMNLLLRFIIYSELTWHENFKMTFLRKLRAIIK